MELSKSTTFLALGAKATVFVTRGESEPAAADALRRAEERAKELDARLSVYRPLSEIALLNAAAGCKPVRVSADTFRLLEIGKMIAQETEGAFSMTTRPLAALWELNARCGTVPSRAEVEEALTLVDDGDLVLNAARSTAELRRFGQSVDLGAIARGFAADEIRTLLLDAGVTRAVVDTGSSIVSIGGGCDVGLPYPGRGPGAEIGRVTLFDASAATSSDSARYFEVEGRRYHHLLDPRTGYPADGELRSVTLVGSSATVLDALSTAAFVLGTKRGAEAARAYGAEALFVTGKMDVLCSEALRGEVALFSAAPRAAVLA